MQITRTASLAACLILAAGGCFAQPAQPTGALKVSNPVAAQFEDGPPLGSLRLIPGEIVRFSFNGGGKLYSKSETRKVQLTGHVQVFDPRGISIFPAEEIPIITTLTEEDKAWKPTLRSAVAIPPIAPPGVYKVKFDVTDDASHQSAKGEDSFDVQAKYVAPANELPDRS